MTPTPYLHNLHGILTKLTEKHRAIWAGSAPPPGSALALTPTLVQDSCEVMFAAASNPWAGISAWLRWSERLCAHGLPPLCPKEEAVPLHKAWLHYLQGLHTLSGQAITDMVSRLDDLEVDQKQRFLFYCNQWMEALSPANNLFTNPELLTYTLECQGENLIRGFDNLLNDISCATGELSISMTDNQAFEVGKNLAITAGTVVVRNEVMELIQYAPTTETVYKRPMLLVPPWINKYYILDLTEKTSMVKWFTDQGYTVFLASWINPDGSQSAGSFADYMKHGILAALAAIETITGEKKPHAAGYCTGGTLLATTLAWLAAGNEDRVASATFMATLIDLPNPGTWASSSTPTRWKPSPKRPVNVAISTGSNWPGPSTCSGPTTSSGTT